MFDFNAVFTCVLVTGGILDKMLIKQLYELFKPDFDMFLFSIKTHSDVFENEKS